MVGILLVLLAAGPDLAVVRDARAAERRDGGKLWGVALDTVPWMFVRDNRIFLTADPHRDGYVASGELWEGPLPPDMPAANTSVSFAGRTWAMVLLPLPDERILATQLLIHEAWHALQLPFPVASEHGAGAALLDSAEGRAWMILEWRSLALALVASGEEQTREVRSALAFRMRRFAAATPEEQARERLLDISEGMAEYTAQKLTWTRASRTSLILIIQEREESFLRSFPYADGPAYGMLLDARLPGWRARLRETPDLQQLLAETVPPNGDLNERGVEAELRRQRARARVRQGYLNDLRVLFTEEPTLRIRPRTLQITFNPHKQTPLGAAGTVMLELVWKDWSELRVPLGSAKLESGVLRAPKTIAGDRWMLKLPANWRLTRKGASWIAEPLVTEYYRAQGLGQESVDASRVPDGGADDQNHQQ